MHIYWSFSTLPFLFNSEIKDDILKLLTFSGRTLQNHGILPHFVKVAVVDEFHVPDFGVSLGA